jgi:hypothetical protein
VKSAVIALLIAGLGFGAFTWWVLESSGVAILQTRGPDGSLRPTHVWHAERSSEVWLEAATPERAWLRDIQRSPLVVLSIEGQPAHYRAAPVAAPTGHAEIRSLLRQKYGLRDWWVALLQDTSRSVAVQLVPKPEQ